MSSSKKLKMERLSPILMVDRAHANLSDSCRTPSWCITPKVSIRKHKDRYAIEDSSSPEFDKRTANSSKHRKTRNPSVRNRVKSIPKKQVSTPLSGIVARKSLHQQLQENGRELPSASGSWASSIKQDHDLAIHAGRVTSPFHTIEEAVTVEEGMDQMPNIGAFQSPQKQSEVHSSEILPPCLVFPSLQHLGTTKSTPLSGIISKKSSGHNRTLNDSISILTTADVEVSEDNFENNKHLNADQPSIECFESPSKPTFDKHLQDMSFDFSSLHFKRQINLPSRAHIQKLPLETIIETTSSKSDTCVEMSGPERKKRKRALDFSSQTFPGSEISEKYILPEISPQLDHHLQLAIPKVESTFQHSEAVVNEDSDAESVIEGTPKQRKVLPKIKDDPLSGFMVSSSLEIDVGIPLFNTKNVAPILEHDSPPSISQPKIKTMEETCNRGFTTAVGSPLFNTNQTAAIIEQNSPPSMTQPKIELIDEISNDGFSIAIGTPIFNTKQTDPIIEPNSPPSMSQPKIKIMEETSNDGFPRLAFDLNFVCHDSSSDESEVDCSMNRIEDKSCFVVPNVPEVLDPNTKSPPLNFNCTGRKIQPYESPSKATKAFSEAINIGMFGSPDSNALHDPEEVGNAKDEEVDDIINVSTTQEEDEFVDESEQIRANKRRKKGSLLERAGFIISKVDASNTLFDYEIKAGLRPSTGKFVSSSLVVCKMWAGENSTHILVCKSLKSCEMDLQERYKTKHTIVAIVVNKVPKDISEGFVVLLHYPLTILYCNSSKIPYIFAGHQLVVDSKAPTFKNSDVLNINNDFIGISNQPVNSIKNPAPESLIKVFPFASIKNFSEAALCQCLVDEFQLSLRVLHFFVDESDPTKKIALLLCSDMERNFGWIKFTLEHDVRRAIALEALNVLIDGTMVQIRGFHVFDRSVLDMKTRNLLNYCVGEIVESTTIFTLFPIESTWVVSCTGLPRDSKKSPVTIENILLQKARGKRFLIEITSTELDEDKNLLVTDSSGKSVRFIPGESAPKMKFELHSMPFFLDGVYYYYGKIFSDEYTKLIPGELHWKL